MTDSTWTETSSAPPDPEPLTPEQVAAIGIRCAAVEEKPWNQVLASDGLPSATTFEGRILIANVREDIPRLISTIARLNEQKQHTDHCIQLASDQIHMEASRRNQAWEKISVLESQIKGLEEENKALRQPRREDRGDSIGTCSLCDYHGPGPAHDCTGNLVKQRDQAREEAKQAEGRTKRVTESTHAAIGELPEKSREFLAIACRTAKCRCWCGCHVGSTFDSNADPAPSGHIIPTRRAYLALGKEDPRDKG